MSYIFQSLVNFNPYVADGNVYLNVNIDGNKIESGWHYSILWVLLVVVFKSEKYVRNMGF